MFCYILSVGIAYIIIQMNLWIIPFSVIFLTFFVIYFSIRKPILTCSAKSEEAGKNNLRKIIRESYKQEHEVFKSDFKEYRYI